MLYILLHQVMLNFTQRAVGSLSIWEEHHINMNLENLLSSWLSMNKLISLQKFFLDSELSIHLFSILGIVSVICSIFLYCCLNGGQRPRRES